MAHILFVDDDPTVGAILHDTLHRMGHQPFGASNIPEALGVIQRVLQNLLRERVSIRDAVSILEALGEGAMSTRNQVLLTEYTRQAMRRTIVSTEAVSQMTGPARRRTAKLASRSTTPRRSRAPAARRGGPAEG